MATPPLSTMRVRARLAFATIHFSYLFCFVACALYWQSARSEAREIASPVEISGFVQQSQLLASDGTTSDHFGQTVALSGDTLLIGAPGDNVGPQSNQGSAYVFRRTGNAWLQEAQLFAPDGTGGDGFGMAIALNGDLAVVGTAFDDRPAGFNAGSVHVFRRIGTTWNFEQQLTPSNPGENDRFGSAVAVTSDTILVGAPMKTGNQGAAYAFRFANGTWSQEAQLTANDSAADDEFGVSVALQGNIALIGAAGKDSDKGTAYVFSRSGTTWMQQTMLSHFTLDAGDRFGQSVALSNGTALIGAPQGQSTDQGAAYVFTQSSGLWNFQTQLLANDGAADDDFGQAVALFNNTALVGAPFDDIGVAPTVVNQGSAYVFTRTGTSWTQQEKLTISGGMADDNAGIAVALGDQIAVLGVWLRDITTNGTTIFDQGAAYVYTVGSVNCQAITINPATLTAGAPNTFYQQTFTASGGTAPYSFTITAGGLPPGLNFNQDTLSGTPTQAGNYGFTLQATDIAGCTTTQSYSLVIAADPCASGGCGTLTATPNPIQVCDGSGLGVTTLTWNAPNVAQTQIRVGAANGTLLTSGGATGSVTTGKWVTNGLQFFFINAVTGATLANTTVALTTAGCETGSGTLTAAPNPIQVCDGSGLGVTTLTWTAQGVTQTQIRVGSANGTLLTSGGATGSVATGKWVTNGMQFFLVNAATGATLATTTVSLTTNGCTNNGGTLTATPNPIQVCDGSGMGVVTLAWSTHITRAVEIRIGSPRGFAYAYGFAAGTISTGKWVTDGMQFFLINADTGATLASTTVNLTTAGCGSIPEVITATPASIQICDGSGLGATTIRWDAPGNRATEVRIGSPTGPLFAAGYATGTAVTGKWVNNGMQFFLINPDTGATLGSVTVTVHANGCSAQ